MRIQRHWKLFRCCSRSHLIYKAEARISLVKKKKNEYSDRASKLGDSCSAWGAPAATINTVIAMACCFGVSSPFYCPLKSHCFIAPQSPFTALIVSWKCFCGQRPGSIDTTGVLAETGQGGPCSCCMDSLAYAPYEA